MFLYINLVNRSQSYPECAFGQIGLTRKILLNFNIKTRAEISIHLIVVRTYRTIQVYKASHIIYIVYNVRTYVRMEINNWTKQDCMQRTYVRTYRNKQLDKASHIIYIVYNVRTYVRMKINKCTKQVI